MTLKNRAYEGRSFTELAFIVMSQTIQATKTTAPFFPTTHTCTFGYPLSAKGTDIAFPEIKQILFF
jgi:hypothetical protein